MIEKARSPRLSTPFTPNSTMLSFRVQGKQFNVRAAAVIVEDGFLLLHRAVTDEMWALPGGRVELGETAAAAVVRELWEETGQAVICAGLAFTVENFFVWQGVPFHELGYCFHVDLPADSRLRDKAMTHHGQEAHLALEFRWLPIAELSKVELFPEFLRTASFDRSSPPIHVVQGTPHVGTGGSAVPRAT